MFENLDPTLKQKWIARLEDSASQQAHGQLSNGHGGYCCLGHYLCIRFPTSVWNRKGLYFVIPENESDTYLDSSVVRELGTDCDSIQTLADLNDGSAGFRKHTLAEIAKIIRAGDLLMDSEEQKR